MTNNKLKAVFGICSLTSILFTSTSASASTFTEDTNVSSQTELFDSDTSANINDNVSVTTTSSIALTKGDYTITGGNFKSNSGLMLTVNDESSLTIDSNTSDYLGSVFNNGTLSISQGFGGRAVNYGTITSIDLDGTSALNNTTLCGTSVYNNSGATIKSLSGSVSGVSSKQGVIYSGLDSTINSESNLTFSNNSATSGGGAIYSYAATINLLGKNTFSGNSSDTWGGAIVGVGGITFSPYASYSSYITLGNKNTFIENSAETEGGAIYNSSNFTIKDGVTFESNSAENNGGAIYNTKSFSIGNAATFKLNTAKNGGAIYNYNSTGTSVITIGTGSNFTSNKASNKGGAIYNATGRKIIIGEKAIFDSNIAELNGGAIYNEGTLTIGKGATFTNNQSTSYDGGAIFTYSDLTLENATFENNKVLTYGMVGGAIAVADNTLTLINGSFLNNYAKSGGGAVYTYTSASLDINGTVFTSNSASSGAGALGVCNGAIIKNAKFTSNKAINNEDGGGAIMLGSSSNTVIENTTFDSNEVVSVKGTSSVVGGGAISTRYSYNGSGYTNNSNATLDISNSVFKNNVSDSNGGAIDNNFYNSVNNTGYVSVINSSFEGNQAVSGVDSASADTNYGGAIYNGDQVDKNGNNAKIWIENSTFTDNSADKGGAIYAGSNSTVYIKATKSSISSGNKATDDASGGFLYADQDSNTTFDINSNATLTIGNNNSGYDSIAGTGDITKSGLGNLTVNGSMVDYTGSLSITDGLMTVNNGLGASTINISSTATLSATINDNDTFTNSQLSISNAGTIKLIAGSNLSADDYYTIATNTALDFDSNGLNAIAYGGTIEDNTFTVSEIKTGISIDSSSTSQIIVDSNNTVQISGTTSGGTSDTAIIMSFNSSNATINSISTNTEDSTFDTIVSSTLGSDIKFSESFSFDVDMQTGDSVVLSFLVGEGYNLSDFTVFHKADAEDGQTTDWEIANISDLTYDGKYLSFIVNDFCEYGYAAVPEPSTYAIIFGGIALGFAMYRRRK